MNREEIINILKAVKPALASKVIIEQTGDFIFQNKKVFTYNDEIMISHPIDLNINGVLPSTEFYNLLNRVRGDEVDIKQEENEVLIKGKGFKAGLSINPDITVPIKTIKIGKEWKKLPKDFCEGIQFCLFSTGTDYSKLRLTHLHAKGNMVESSDDFRVSRYTIQKIKDELLIPLKAGAELIKYNPTLYQCTKNWVHCKNKAGVIFSFRVSIKEYPDTSPVLKMGDCVNMSFPSTLPNSIQSAESVCKEEITGDKYVKVIVDDKELHVHGRGDLGWYKHNFKLKRSYSKKKIEFEINSESFREILQHLKKATLSKTKLKFEGENFIHVMSVKEM